MQNRKITLLRVVQLAFLLSLLLVCFKFFLTDPAGMSLLRSANPLR